MHESGIHQNGILKSKNTYEIINPIEIGITVNPIVLGKLSGRAALKDKIREFGLNPKEEELNKMFDKFKEIASTKKFLLDNHIIDIINQNAENKISQSLRFKLTDGSDSVEEIISINLDNQIIAKDNKSIKFEIDPVKKYRILKNLDQIGVTLAKIAKIINFEKNIDYDFVF